MTQKSISNLSNFGEIGNITKMLKEGRDVAYIAEHFFLDIAGSCADNRVEQKTQGAWPT